VRRYAATPRPWQDLAITNTGSLSLSLSVNPFMGYSALAAINAGTADITNNGDISVSKDQGNYNQLSGIFGGETVTNNGTISATGASLTTSQLNLGSTDNVVTIAGGFSGSIAGGTGNNRIDVSGGSAMAPVAFGGISGIETLRMSAGLPPLPAAPRSTA